MKVQIETTTLDREQLRLMLGIAYAEAPRVPEDIKVVSMSAESVVVQLSYYDYFGEDEDGS